MNGAILVPSRRVDDAENRDLGAKVIEAIARSLDRERRTLGRLRQAARAMVIALGLSVATMLAGLVSGLLPDPGAWGMIPVVGGSVGGLAAVVAIVLTMETWAAHLIGNLFPAAIRRPRLRDPERRSPLARRRLWSDLDGWLGDLDGPVLASVLRAIGRTEDLETAACHADQDAWTVAAAASALERAGLVTLIPRPGGAARRRLALTSEGTAMLEATTRPASPSAAD